MRTETTIDASPERVWKALIEVDQYPSWHPMIHNLENELRPGGRGVLVVKAGRRTANVKIRYRKVEPERELSWKGGIPGLFTGMHYFRLEDAGDGRTRLAHGEEFDGPLARLTMPLVKGKLQTLYGKVTDAVRKRAEQQ